jgi:hypothetical protein
MANIFVDDTATGTPDGTSMTDAYTDLAAVLISALSAGDTVWVRRTTLQDISADVDLTADGTSVLPIKVIGWPRAAKSTSGVFTQGSKIVTGIVSNDMLAFAHNGRSITGPDGNPYWIETIDSTSQVTLNCEYIGDTVTGSFTIKADEYYDEAQALGDVLISTWNADPDVVPGLNYIAAADFNGAGDYYWTFANIQFIGNAKSFFNMQSLGWRVINCYIIQPNAYYIFSAISFSVLINCIISGADVTSNYIYTYEATFLRCSFINTGPFIHSGSTVILDDCNRSGSINAFYQNSQDCEVILKNCSLPLSQLWYSVVATPTQVNGAWIEDAERVKGVNTKYINGAGWVSSNDGSGADVNLRSGGSDKVIDILFDINASRIGRKTEDGIKSNPQSTAMVFEHRIWQTSFTAKTYRYYVQSVTDALTSSELWLEAEDAYGNVTKSDEAIAARSGAGDWTNYIEAAVTQPVAGWITLRCFCTKYSATLHKYIDPQVEVA